MVAIRGYSVRCRDGQQQDALEGTTQRKTQGGSCPALLGTHPATQ